ncbi:HD domain-containing protein [Mollisia scopiformis]|uniref:HD domain-containing protein n=1 Tax=Mollisia scopiformis TaxID=149040 RepID=A0A194XRM5_MOLSC|nr:HD domain-containing protein [Mollisia scopiformis]KUJ22940.1 HD domain-containing protein [Mollisia scopiformis]
MQELISNVSAYVEKHMSNYDGSHDFHHILRVVGLAHRIHDEMTIPITGNDTKLPILDRDVITLSALLHDVGDRKYVKEGEDAQTMVRDVLLNFGASYELAERVQTICLGVSYSSEIKNLDFAADLISRYPELACVQDADRIDAIGATGIGRLFTYGGAKTKRSMDGSINIMDEKLFKLEDMMKTASGKILARERTRRLREFHSWWEEEMDVACPHSGPIFQRH